jgi:hypothetical protein
MHGDAVSHRAAGTGFRTAWCSQHKGERRNTVQYRICKAQEAVGRPTQDRRSDLELALRICHYLGSVVLRPVGR